MIWITTTTIMMTTIGIEHAVAGTGRGSKNLFKKQTLRVTGNGLRRAVRMAVILLLIAIAGHSNAADMDWPTSAPEQQGVDSTKLVELCRHLNQANLDIRSLLIVRNGHLIFERYEQNLTRNYNFAMYSVTKSVTSTLIGIMIDRKMIDSVDRAIAPAFADVRMQNHDARVDHIRIADLLTMRWGLQWKDTVNGPADAGSDMTGLIAADDRLSFVLNHPMSNDPGTHFNYSNGDAQLAAAIIARGAKAPVPSFAKVNLFDRLGFVNWEWCWPDGRNLHPGGYGLRLRARDMAKFGQLFLNDGLWNNRRIVSSEWIHQATLNQTKSGYGYFWWINQAGGHPAYCAIGLHGQYVLVIPDLKMVITMTALLDEAKKNEIFNKLVTDLILPAVQADTALKPNPAAVKDLDAQFRAALAIHRDQRDLSEDDTPRIPGAARPR